LAISAQLFPYTLWYLIRVNSSSLVHAVLIISGFKLLYHLKGKKEKKKNGYFQFSKEKQKFRWPKRKMGLMRKIH
jgi:hypothetical protein